MTPKQIEEMLMRDSLTDMVIVDAVVRRDNVIDALRVKAGFKSLRQRLAADGIGDKTIADAILADAGLTREELVSELLKK